MKREARLTFEHDGRTLILWKRAVHQWRTDIVLSVDGREYVIGREEAPMTRREVKELAQRWLETHQL